MITFELVLKEVKGGGVQVTTGLTWTGTVCDTCGFDLAELEGAPVATSSSPLFRWFAFASRRCLAVMSA